MTMYNAILLVMSIYVLLLAMSIDNAVLLVMSIYNAALLVMNIIYEPNTFIWKSIDTNNVWNNKMDIVRDWKWAQRIKVSLHHSVLWCDVVVMFCSCCGTVMTDWHSACISYSRLGCLSVSLQKGRTQLFLYNMPECCGLWIGRGIRGFGMWV